MSNNILKNFVEYLQCGFYTKSGSEITLKIYLIYMFSLVGFIFVLFLGLKGYESSSYILTTLLLGGSLALALNLIYLKVTEDHVFSENVIFYIFFLLMVYLVYSGGVENTGPLWIFCLPPIALFIHGLKKGLIELSIFIFILLFILYGNETYFLDAYYTDAFKLRIVLSFLVLVLLSSFYQYSREKSVAKMKNLQKDLEFFLKRDELTGLYNRRAYQDSASKINNDNGAVLMCDIDHFKKINDSYGHSAGDFVIQEIANSIQESIRRDDTAIRWGGEEFLIFLSNTNIDNAFFVSEKIRRSIENLYINYKDKIIHVTISIGIAEVNEETTLDDAIKHADNAMYLSKSLGRNKTSRHTS